MLDYAYKRVEPHADILRAICQCDHASRNVPAASGSDDPRNSAPRPAWRNRSAQNERCDTQDMKQGDTDTVHGTGKGSAGREMAMGGDEE